jgi:hypothetical protein
MDLSSNNTVMVNIGYDVAPIAVGGGLDMCELTQ